jgi:hypothetical protein
MAPGTNLAEKYLKLVLPGPPSSPQAQDMNLGRSQEPVDQRRNSSGSRAANAPLATSTNLSPIQWNDEPVFTWFRPASTNADNFENPPPTYEVSAEEGL